MIQDHMDQLWLSTNNGLLRYDTKKNTLTQFSGLDGLDHNIFARDSRLLASDSSIWFGSEKGLTVFRPDHVKTQSTPVVPFIERAWINGKEWNKETSINEIPTITFQYFENTIEFEIRTLGFFQGENIYHQYRLENYDDTWGRVKNGGVIRFTKVPPGNYNLKIDAYDRNEQKGFSKQLEIIIPPPFWQTLWFRLLMISLAILTIVLAVGFYYQRKLIRQKQLMQQQQLIYDERDRIAKELHDDMGGGLSSILFLSDDILFEEKDREKAKRIGRISTLAKESLNNMRDIIWALDETEKTLGDLLRRIQQTSHQFLKDHAIELEFTNDVHQNKILLGSSQKRNIVLLVKECLHNIAKHAEATKVEILFSTEKSIFNIMITDNGKGFNFTPDKAKGRGIHNMKYRCNVLNGTMKINTKTGLGTSIQFSIPT